MVTTIGEMDTQELLNKLSKAIEAWETSPYYMPEEEMFDLERFLLEHRALELKKELEEIYGIPLNHKFWSSFLAYHRLKRAREEIKTQDDLQEDKRRHFLRVIEEEKKSWQKWLKEWFPQHQRHKIKVLPGGKKDTHS